MFRCCLPCRGGSGSAAPATSPPQTPNAQTPQDGAGAGADVGAEDSEALPPPLPLPPSNHQQKDNLSKDYIKSEKLSPDSKGEELLYTEKKHSLADTINTSVTTPISLKTLINDCDVEAELRAEAEVDQQLSAADIAAASLASGLVARRAEPETLSDASVSPTAVVQHQQQQQPLVPTIITTTNTNNNLLSQVTTLYSNPTNPTANPSPNQSQNQTPNTNPNPGQSQGQSQSQNQGQRCACQAQTSPLPHIKEEEESEQANSAKLQRQEEHQLPPITIAGGGYCGSCESIHHSSATSSSQGGAGPSGGSQPGQDYIPGGSKKRTIQW